MNVYIKKLLATLLVYIVLFENFRSIIEINLLYVYIPLLFFVVYIFYPRIEDASTSRLKLALGLIFTALGVFWILYMLLGYASYVGFMGGGNIFILILAYDLFWVVLGAILIKKSHIQLSHIFK